MKKKKFGRRKFIKLAGQTGMIAAADPVVKQMLGSIYDGYINEAKAQGITPRNLVYFGMLGGATSWYFHNPLAPSPGDQNLFLNGSKQVATRINGVSADQRGNPVYNLEYATTQVSRNGKTLNMPHMFSWTMPHSNGGQRPTTDICENMLMIRGIEMDDNSHDFNQRKMYGPIPGEPSITGIGADASQTNLPFVSVGDSPYFKSLKGTGEIKVSRSENNYISKIMEPFESPVANSFRGNLSLRDRIYSALGVIKGHSGGENNFFKGLLDTREKAEAVIVAGISEFIQEFETARAKYENLIHRSIRNTNLPGLTDQPLPGCQFPITVEGDVEFKGNRSENGYRYATCQFQHYSKVMCGSDIRNYLTNISLRWLDKEFAMIEVLLKNNLCSTISCQLYAINDIEWIYGQNLSRSYDSSTNTTTFNITSEEPETSYSFGYDNHSGGYLISLLIYTLQYRAFASCLAELQDQLKNVTYSNGKNAWNETLVVLYSEMGRAPDDRGTEHYGNGNAIAMWGGVLKFDCLGDIYNESYSNHLRNSFPGTFGSGKEMVSSDPNLNNRRIINANVASTIAAICRYPISPAPNNNSLVNVDEISEVAQYKISTGKTYARA
jgi:hypothetical protein